jgi:molybdopterin synthase catalytic subunit
MKVISIVGYHKAGKTTLVERLVKELSKHGRVGTVKHTREEILPQAGDTERHLNAGSEVTIGVTRTRLIKIIKTTSIQAVLDQLLDEGLDFAVVEGFKESGIPKIGIGDVTAKNIVARVDIAATGEELAKIALGQPDYVTLKYLIARTKRSPRIKDARAIGTFTGILQEAPGDEKASGTDLRGSREEAKQSIKKIEEDLKKREGILDVYISPGTGCFGAGDGLIYVVILAMRREEVLPALENAIDRVSAEMPTDMGVMSGTGDFWIRDIR